MAKLMVGQYDESVECAAQALLYRPNYWYPLLIRMAALQHSGRSKDYCHAKKTFESRNLKLGPRCFDWVPFENKKWIEDLRSHAV